MRASFIIRGLFGIAAALILAGAWGCDGAIIGAQDAGPLLPDSRIIEGGADTKGTPDVLAPTDLLAKDSPCANHCKNSVADCGETDVDCGGKCTPCAEVKIWSAAGQSTEFPTVAATKEKVIVAWSIVGKWGVYYRCKDALGWGAVSNLSTGSGGTKFTRAQADSKGRIHLVVTRGAGGAVVYAMLSDDATCAKSSWSSPKDIATMSTGGGRYPQVAVDVNDAPHACWHDKDYTDVYYGEATSGKWSSPINVTNTSKDADSRYPDISIQGTTPHFVWEEDDASYSNTRPRYTYKTGSGFAPWKHLSQQRHSWPQVVVEPGGDVHVLFTTRDGKEVRYWQKKSGVWQPYKAVNSAPTKWSWTSLTLDGKGFLHGVWHQLVGGKMQIFYSTAKGPTGAWGAPGQVSTVKTADNEIATVATDPAGHAHVAWRRLSGSESMVYYRKVSYADVKP